MTALRGSKIRIMKKRCDGIDLEASVSAKLALGILTTCLLVYLASSLAHSGGTPATSETSDAEAIRHERQMYQNRVQSNLNDLDRRIAALKSRLRKEDKAGLRKRDQQIPELDRKRAFAYQKLDNLKTSSREAWGDMKAGIDTAMDDLETGYQQAHSHLN